MKTFTLILLLFAAEKYTAYATKEAVSVEIVPHDYGSKAGDAVVAALAGMDRGLNNQATTSCSTLGSATNCTTQLPDKKTDPEPTYKEAVATKVKLKGFSFLILNRDKKATFTVGKEYTIWTDSKVKKFYLISNEGDRWEALLSKD